MLGVGVSPFRLTALASALGIALLLYWFIRKSRLGVQIRALAGDEKLAQVSGINPLAVTVLIWFLAGMAGGAAGAFYGVEHLRAGRGSGGTSSSSSSWSSSSAGQGGSAGSSSPGWAPGSCSPSWS